MPGAPCCTRRGASAAGASLTPVCTTAALSSSHVSRLGIRQLLTTQGLRQSWRRGARAAQVGTHAACSGWSASCSSQAAAAEPPAVPSHLQHLWQSPQQQQQQQQRMHPAAAAHASSSSSGSSGGSTPTSSPQSGTRPRRATGPRCPPPPSPQTGPASCGWGKRCGVRAGGGCGWGQGTRVELLPPPPSPPRQQQQQQRQQQQQQQQQRQQPAG